LGVLFLAFEGDGDLYLGGVLEGLLLGLDLSIAGLDCLLGEDSF
jgi:hypothetical protein